MASKLRPQQADKSEMEIREKTEILWWARKGERAGIHRGTNAFGRKVAAEALFDSVLPARSWEMPVECELPAKLGRCLPQLREIIHFF